MVNHRLTINGNMSVDAVFVSLCDLIVAVADVSSLSGLTNLTRLYLNDNLIETITGLVSNTDLATGDYVALTGNELTVNAACVDVPAIRGRGASVLYTGGVSWGHALGGS